LLMVDVDVGQIGQVIQNMVINAKQAMAQGGVVHISCVNAVQGYCPEGLGAGTFVKIIVRDEGEGIPPAILDSIFDPYFTTKTDGSGLGLAVCHSIMHKHGGAIQVSSTLSVGTEFTLYLPSVAEDESAQEIVVNKTALPGGRVLVMDDEKIVRQVAMGMLEFLGYVPLEAKNGDEAIGLVRKYYGTDLAVDAVIMDLTIPGGMGGEEAVIHINNMDPTIKTIVASGYSNDPILAHCRDYGFMASLVKPFSMKELTRVMALVFDMAP
ncbi:MAG: ATP-binding protein, partial [Spirochaetales bacterium]|nr:ATP-binding protein [Spirochaetales bacterium]